MAKSCYAAIMMKIFIHLTPHLVKGVNYFGLNSDYIVSGRDCGHVFLWDKHTTDIVQYLKGDFEGQLSGATPPYSYLAVSGLDHDIKLISPSSEKVTDLEGLDEVVETNAKRRIEDSEYSLDGYDLILSFIMRHYRRGLRRRAGIESDDDSTSNDSDYVNNGMMEDCEDEDGDDDNDGEPHPEHHPRRSRNNGEEDQDEDDDSREEPLQCMQS